MSKKELLAIKDTLAQQAKEFLSDKTLLLDRLWGINKRLQSLEDAMRDNSSSTDSQQGLGEDDIRTEFSPDIQLTEKYFLEFGLDRIQPIIDDNFHLLWEPVAKKIPKVAIIDTGIDVHNFLKPNLKGGINYSDSGDRTDWIDRNGHGTNVASIVKTVCPEVDLYAVKTISDYGRGSNESLVRGIDWCIWNDMDVINISLGSQRHYAPLEFKVREAVKKGIFISCAAGNDYRGTTNTVDYPGRYDDLVCTVAALTDSDQHATFSSSGEEVDIAVRGVKIFGALRAPDVWGYRTGTSQAAPHIAGLAASMIRICPQLSPEDMMRIIKDTAIDLGEKGDDNIFGAGLVNPKGIFEYLLQYIKD